MTSIFNTGINPHGYDQNMSGPILNTSEVPVHSGSVCLVTAGDKGHTGLQGVVYPHIAGIRRACIGVGNCKDHDTAGAGVRNINGLFQRHDGPDNLRDCGIRARIEC